VLKEPQNNFSRQNPIAKLCQSIFQRQIALYSPCRSSSSSRFVTINFTSIKPSMKVRNLTYVHHIILSASSVDHQCIISASSGHHQGIIRASRAPSAHRQCIISASLLHHHCIISASSAHHPDQKGSIRLVHTLLCLVFQIFCHLIVYHTIQ